MAQRTFPHRFVTAAAENATKEWLRLKTKGMVELFTGRIEEVLQIHHFRSGEELEATLHR